MIKQLNDICSFVSGNAWKAAEFADEGIPIIRINNMNTNDNDFVYWQGDYDKRYLINKGDLLVSLSGTIKTFQWNGPEALLNQRIVKVIANPDTNQDWVYYQISHVIEEIANKGKHAVIKNVSVNELKNFEVDVPDLQTQNKIVAILDKASALVQKRQKTIDLLDELLRAQFLVLFGDPLVNPKKWPKRTLKEIGEIITGNTPPREKKEYYDSNFIEWIKTDNILSDQIYLSSSGEHLSVLGLTKGRSVKNKSLLVACIAGSLSSIGRAAINDREVAFNQQINAIVPNKDTSVYFLYFLFKYASQYIQDFATKGMKKIITKGVFSTIAIISPPYQQQLEFEILVISQLSFKTKLLNAKQEISNLYNSLIQQAFSGNLSLDVSVELDALLEEIDLQKPDNDLYSILSNEEYINSLVERLNKQDFENQDLYDKAKHAAFQLLKTDEILAQKYDEDTKSLKLVVK